MSSVHREGRRTRRWRQVYSAAVTHFKGDLHGGNDGRFNYIYDGSRFHSDGYREHSTVTRDLYNAKFKMPAPNGNLTVVVNAIDQPETQDPLGLSRAQLNSNPRQADPSALLFNTRKSVRQSQLGLVYDMNLGGADKIQARTYIGDRQVTQYQAIPLAAQSLPSASGGVVDQDFGYEGIGLRWTHTISEGERPLNFTVGADYDRMAQHRLGYINISASRVRSSVRETSENSDAFAQVEWKFAPLWSTTADCLQQCALHFERLLCRSRKRQRRGQLSKNHPVAGVLFNLTPAVNVYANIGRVSNADVDRARVPPRRRRIQLRAAALDAL